MKKYISGFLCLSIACGIYSGAAVAEDTVPSGILVCRARQCAEAGYSMTKGFLFNKITQMMKNNTGKTVLLCEADPVSHVCLDEGIRIPAETSFADTDILIDSMKLVDEKLMSGKTTLDVVFDYKIQANGTFPDCQLGISRLTVDYVDKVEMTTQDILCNLTETGRTAINATYNIDYLDFDYGFIGAYYTIGVGEAVMGDKSGYVLMRFTHEVELSSDEFLDKDAAQVAAERAAAQKKEALPAILRDTKPETPFMPHTIKLPPPPVELQSVVPAPDPEEDVLMDAELVEEVETKTTPQRPTVVKTTVVEKTVITSDGNRTIEPPLTRTIVSGELPQ